MWVASKWRHVLLALIFAVFADLVSCANEEDNPFAFLRFEHHELSKDTFVKVPILHFGQKYFRTNLRTEISKAAFVKVSN
jgi:hypothetical protein